MGHAIAEEGGIGWKMSQNVGHVFTNGVYALSNESAVDLTLVEIRPVMGVGTGLRYLGVKLAGSRRRIGSVQYIPQYPPRDVARFGPMLDVAGTRMKPLSPTGDNMFEVMLGFKVVGEGRSSVKGMTITYDQGGHRYTQFVKSTLAVCAPKDDQAPCPPEGF
jgi:hypothetical protein